MTQRQIIKLLLSIIIVSFISFLSYQSTHPIAPPQQRLLLTDYYTSPDRMKITNILCKNFDRKALITAEDRQQNINYKKDLKTSITTNGNDTLNAFFNDKGSLQKQIEQQQTGLGFYIGPFAVAFLLLILMWPFLCCCCCCPNCCPPKCCRQPQNKLYSGCELKWPLVMLILLLVMSTGSGIYGLTSSAKANSYISKMMCSLSLVPDDMLNGNVTADGSSLFIGFNKLKQTLGWFKGNISTINTLITNFNSSNANISNSLTAGATLLSNMINIDSTGGNGMPSITYNSPISANSRFPSIFGSYNTNGLIYSYYEAIKKIIASIEDLGNNSKEYLDSSAVISTAITSSISSITTLIDQLSSIDNFSSIADMLNPSNINVTYIQLPYIVIIGLSVLIMLGSILILLCDMVKCRYLLYFLCMFIFIIAFVGLFITTFISVSLPLLSWTCDYMNVAFSDKQNFYYNFRALDPTFKQHLARCMPFSDGNILESISADLKPINKAADAFTTINTFNATSINGQIDTLQTNFLNTIDQYGRSELSDLSTNDISKLAFFANKSNYPTCTNSQFLQDSFVPSINQSPIYVSCLASTSNQAGKVECSGVNSYSPFSGSCFGCLDMPQIFKGNSSILTATSNRYGGSCNTFAGELSNLWTNYYSVKQTLIGNSISPVSTVGIYGKTVSLQPSLTTFKNSLTNIHTQISNINGTINSLDKILDTKYGLLGGLNCKIFGQDFQNILDTSCIGLFNTLYILRFSLGIASFGIFFSLCCIVCAGGRQARQSEYRSNQQAKHDKNQVENEERFKADYRFEPTLQSINRHQ